MFKKGKVSHVKAPRIKGLAPQLGLSNNNCNDSPLMEQEQLKKKTDIKLWLCPHPYDIDFNSYDSENLTRSNIFHMLMWIIVLLLLPVATYFVEFKLSINLAIH